MVEQTLRVLAEEAWWHETEAVKAGVVGSSKLKATACATKAEAMRSAIAIIKAAKEWQDVRSNIAEGVRYQASQYDLMKAEQALLSLLSLVEQKKEG